VAPAGVTIDLGGRATLVLDLDHHYPLPQLVDGERLVVVSERPERWDVPALVSLDEFLASPGRLRERGFEDLVVCTLESLEGAHLFAALRLGVKRVHLVHSHGAVLTTNRRGALTLWAARATHRRLERLAPPAADALSQRLGIGFETEHQGLGACRKLTELALRTPIDTQLENSARVEHCLSADLDPTVLRALLAQVARDREAKRRVGLTLLARLPSERILGLLRGSGARVRVLYPAPPLSTRGGARWGWLGPDVYRALRRHPQAPLLQGLVGALRGERLEALTGWGWSGGLLGISAAALLGTPRLRLVAREAPPLKSWEASAAAELGRALRSNPSRVTLGALGQPAPLAQALDLDLHRIQVHEVLAPSPTPKPLTSAQRDQARALLGLRSGDPLVLALGPLLPDSGAERLVTLAESSFRDIPGLRLWALGGGELEFELRLQARELDCAEAFQVHAGAPDALDYIELADGILELPGADPTGIARARALDLPILSLSSTRSDAELRAELASLLGDAPQRAG